jgi:hypothetical protein
MGTAWIAKGKLYNQGDEGCGYPCIDEIERQGLW